MTDPRNKPCATSAQELQQTCCAGEHSEQSFVVVGTRIDIPPPILYREKVQTRYRVDLTEQQISYLHKLISYDWKGDLTSGEFNELVGFLCYHHSSIHGPADTDDRPPPADNE